MQILITCFGVISKKHEVEMGYHILFGTQVVLKYFILTLRHHPIFCDVIQ